jgi:hypothetical protein
MNLSGVAEAVSTQSTANRVAIRSGGQTGVDRAALDFAIAHNIPYSGWCPRGGVAEDFGTPPGLLGSYTQLSETPSSRPEQRTAWNVRDSHATLVLLDHQGLQPSDGTRFAVLCARLIFLRPLHITDATAPDAVGEARRWLSLIMESSGDETSFTLNVAGPRQSKSPGIYNLSMQCLTRILT